MQNNKRLKILSRTKLINTNKIYLLFNFFQRIFMYFKNYKLEQNLYLFSTKSQTFKVVLKFKKFCSNLYL